MLLERANAGLHDFVWNKIVTPLLPQQAVLDIGCGSGVWLQRFQQAQVPTLLGLDLDTAQFAVPGIPTQAINFDQYHGQQFGSFSLITCLELLEHLENPGLLCDLIQQHLATNGLCILSTPNMHSRNARLRYALKGELGHFDTKSDPTHIYPVYTDNLKKLLQKRKMELVAVHAFPDGGPSRNYDLPVRTLTHLLSPFMRKTFEGDNIVYVIRHVANQQLATSN